MPGNFWRMFYVQRCLFPESMHGIRNGMIPARPKNFKICRKKFRYAISAPATGCMDSAMIRYSSSMAALILHSAHRCFRMMPVFLKLIRTAFRRVRLCSCRFPIFRCMEKQKNWREILNQKTGGNIKFCQRKR